MLRICYNILKENINQQNIQHNVENRQKGLRKVKICIDAGHYGKYNQSPLNSNYYESEIVWKIHNVVADILNKRGFEIVKTREKENLDLELTARGKKAENCDLFLSVHTNACNNSKIKNSLACCMITDKNSKLDDVSLEIGKKLSDTVTEIMTGAKNGGGIYQRKGSNNKDYYGVLRGAKSVGTAGVLLECGYHTNKENVEFLMNDNNITVLGMAIADVITNYFGNNVFKPYLVKINSSDGYVNVRRTPTFENNDIVSRLENSGSKFTIIGEKIVDGVKFGKLKSGAGYVALNCCKVV